MTKAKDRIPTSTAPRFVRMTTRTAFLTKGIVAAHSHFQELLRQISSGHMDR